MKQQSMNALGLTSLLQVSGRQDITTKTSFFFPNVLCHLYYIFGSYYLLTY